MVQVYEEHVEQLLERLFEESPDAPTDQRLLTMGEAPTHPPPTRRCTVGGDAPAAAGEEGLVSAVPLGTAGNETGREDGDVSGARI